MVSIDTLLKNNGQLRNRNKSEALSQPTGPAMLFTKNMRGASTRTKMGNDGSSIAKRASIASGRCSYVHYARDIDIGAEGKLH